MVNGTSNRRRWLLVALVVSLGLNLFFGGLMFGRWFSGPPIRHMAILAEHGPGGGLPGRSILDRMAASLPPEHRPSFESTIAKHRERITQAAAQVREARDRVHDAMRKEPFDRATLEQAFENMRNRNDALQTAIQTAISEAAASLPSDARQRLADWRVRGRGDRS